ncbi:MAG: DNA-binding response regulator [Actinobacteria bacterium]|nr:DNA-binding response regulator [Actinomycetota bacterium]NBY15301.1 DNA-binding response regulator [Actinomycetota bacterium]
MSPNILVIEDDHAVSETLDLILQSAGFNASFSYDGSDAIETFKATNPDLVLLDLNLPNLDGLDVFKGIRAISAVPIIILTARDNSDDIVKGLELGADDYIPKPWRSNEELIARIKSRLRPVELSSASELRIGDIVIDVLGHKVRRGTTVIPLTVLEFKILATLAKQPAKVFTREALLEEVWDYRHSADTRLVNVHIQRLRAKVELDPDKPEIVVTVRGVGYKAGPA